VRRGVASLAALLVLSAAAVLPHPAAAQVDGHVSLLVDTLPDVDAASGRQTVTEGRIRLFAERRLDIGEHWRINLAGHVDGLAAARDATGAATAYDAIVRPMDLYVEFATSRFDVRAGASRLVWGRLDEFQPTDVVNPIDLSRFLLEGRAEARLPVGLVRSRVFLPGATTIEAVVVPAFRSGRFDQLDEHTSPFNLSRPPGGVRVIRDEPTFGAPSLQGGMRLTSTIGRVDVGASAYRGLRAFPIVSVTGSLPTALDPSAAPSLPPALPGPPEIVETFPRFTMLGGDFETVRGKWGVRGEIAAFLDDVLQSTSAARGVPGTSIESGVGVDRRAGDYRVAINVLLSHRSPDRSDPVGAAFAGVDEVDRTDVSLVGAVDRSFVNDTRMVRVFTVYDPADRTMFTRVIGAVSLRDNLWLEGSGGLFAGASLDTLGRLTNRDFAYARLKVFF
jgi:hypothetical protein